MVHFPKWSRLRPWRQHSLVLLLAGLIYGGIGTSFFFYEIPGPRYNSLIVALSFAPLYFWAVMFILVGMLAILSARWPTFNEKWGYIALTGLAAWWSAIHFLGIIFVDTDKASSTMGLIWLLITVLWLSITRLMNPEDIVVVINRDRS